MERQTLSTGTEWEPIVGYSRAVRMGGMVAVAGTTSVDSNGAVLHPGDPYRQTQHILKHIAQVLEHFGTDINHVIRTRMFVVNIDDWLHIGRAHGEVFSSIRPAATMVEVRRLIHPDLLVEIEVDAVLPEKSVTG